MIENELNGAVSCVECVMGQSSHSLRIKERHTVKARGEKNISMNHYVEMLMLHSYLCNTFFYTHVVMSNRDSKFRFSSTLTLAAFVDSLDLGVVY